MLHFMCVINRFLLNTHVTSRSLFLPFTLFLCPKFEKKKRKDNKALTFDDALAWVFGPCRSRMTPNFAPIDLWSPRRGQKCWCRSFAFSSPRASRLRESYVVLVEMLRRRGRAAQGGVFFFEGLTNPLIVGASYEGAVASTKMLIAVE